MNNNNQSGQTGLVLAQQLAPNSVKQFHLYPQPAFPGDMYYGADGLNFNRLPIGTEGSLLVVSSSKPSYISPGSNGQVLTIAAGAPTWQTPTVPTINTANIADGAVTNRKMKLDQIQVVTSTVDMATGSTTYVAHSGLTLTFTPNVASNLLVLLQLNNYNGAVTGINSFVIELDTVIQGNDPLITKIYLTGEVANSISQSAFLWITGVSAAAHTVQVYGKSNAGGTIHTTYGCLTVIPFAQ